MITEREKTLEDLINDALDSGDEERFMVLSEIAVDLNNRLGAWQWEQ